MEKLKNAVVTNTAPSADLDLRTENEVHTYLHAATVNSEDCALQFWKQHAIVYPNLNIMARSYLSISSSSVQVEGMFSTRGLLLNAKRMSMAPYRANVVAVIHDNYLKFFPLLL